MKTLNFGKVHKLAPQTACSLTFLSWLESNSHPSWNPSYISNSRSNSSIFFPHWIANLRLLNLSCGLLPVATNHISVIIHNSPTHFLLERVVVCPYKCTYSSTGLLKLPTIFLVAFKLMTSWNEKDPADQTNCFQNGRKSFTALLQTWVNIHNLQGTAKIKHLGRELPVNKQTLLKRRNSSSQ